MNDNLYPIDPNLKVELSRLLRQDTLLTEHISGLLPSYVDPTKISRVLDIGCGPGGWLTELARRYPQAQLYGLDISKAMIEHAVFNAQAEHLENVHFSPGSFTQLPFPDESFDFINARLVQWFIDMRDRENVLREWYRVLRPNGYIRFIEGETVISNNYFQELLTKAFLLILHRDGKTLTPVPPDKDLEATSLLEKNFSTWTPRTLGLALTFRPLLASWGCKDIRIEAKFLDYSAGVDAHEPSVANLQLAYMSFLPYMMSEFPDLNAEQHKQLQSLSIQGMQKPDYLGMELYILASGQKPEKAS